MELEDTSDKEPHLLSLTTLCMSVWRHDAVNVHVLFLIFSHLFVFDWLLQIVVPPLPGKALKRQLPFRGDDGIFEDEFIEERRKGLEMFVNK